MFWIIPEFPYIPVMILARTFLYALPLLGLLFLVLIFNRVSDLEYVRKDKDLVYLIKQPIGQLNPLLPSTGLTREITDLIFDPLLVRDENLEIQPHILEEWDFQSFVTIVCLDEPSAVLAEKALRDLKSAPDVQIRDITREKGILLVAVPAGDQAAIQKTLAAIQPEHLANFVHLQLRVDHSARESISDFLDNSVEKHQIQILNYPTEDAVDLFLKGKTELFETELRLYYASNQLLHPKITSLGQSSHIIDTEMTMRIRDDVVWHDGSALTIDDVLFSFRELTRAHSNYPVANLFRFVEQIEKIDDWTARIQGNKLTPQILESWEKLPVLPSKLLSPIPPEEWVNHFEAPLGNGPYRFAKRRPDGGVELIANQQYFKPPPIQRHLVYRHISDRESRLRAIRFGNVDVFWPDEREAQWADRNPKYVESVQYQARFQNLIVWNLEKDLFSNRDIRHALGQAVDLDLTLRDDVNTFQKRTDGLFFPGMKYVKKPMHLLSYDSVLARSYLQKNNYIKRENSYYVKAGKRLEFSLTVNSDNLEHLRLARDLVAQWSEFGVAVEIVEASLDEIVSKALVKREFDAVLLGWEIPLERDRYGTWHSSQIGKGNICHLRDEQVDQLVVKLGEARSDSDAAEITGELHDRIFELQPCLFICDTGRRVVFRRDSIQLVRPLPEGRWEVKQFDKENSGYRNYRSWWVRSDLVPEGNGGDSYPQ